MNSLQNIERGLVVDIATINLFVGWISLLGGVLSGMGLGLFFHREGWLGGYGSFRRRLLRLGHIAFFGLGFLNLLFALSLARLPSEALSVTAASIGLAVGAVTMPLCCFLTAWRTPFRHLFALPATCVLVGVAGLLLGWVQP
jgi:hypothetical protein